MVVISPITYPHEIPLYKSLLLMVKYPLNPYDIPLNPSKIIASHPPIPIKSHLIELDDGKIYRKTLYLVVKTMVSG